MSYESLLEKGCSTHWWYQNVFILNYTSCAVTLLHHKTTDKKLHCLWCKKIVHFAHSCKRSFLCCLFLAFYDSDVACEVTFKSCFYLSYILIKLATKMYDLATIFFPFVTGRLLQTHKKHQLWAIISRHGCSQERLLRKLQLCFQIPFLLCTKP